jgi:hypothetical protein
VDGLDEETPVDLNPYAMGDNLHVRDMHHRPDGTLHAASQKARDEGQSK